MSVTTAPPQSDSPLVNLTEAGLLKLLNDVQRGGGYLPPGAYRDESGKVWRDVHEPTGRLRTNKVTGQKEAINRVIRRAVYLTYDLSPEGLVAGRKAAARRGLDFYWPGPGLEGAPGLPRGDSPEIGWLRNGTKREVDVASNLGSGAERYEMQYVPVESEDDESGSSSTMQGFPIEPEASPVTPAEAGPNPFSDEALAVASAASAASRPQRGH